MKLTKETLLITSLVTIALGLLITFCAYLLYFNTVVYIIMIPIALFVAYIQTIQEVLKNENN